MDFSGDFLAWMFGPSIYMIWQDCLLCSLVVSQLPKENITDAAWRKKFIQEKINIIQHGFLDGLNYDPEYGVDLGSPERKALVDLVNETKIALRKVLPDSKVRTCNLYECHTVFTFEFVGRLALMLRGLRFAWMRDATIIRV